MLIAAQVLATHSPCMPQHNQEGSMLQYHRLNGLMRPIYVAPPATPGPGSPSNNDPKDPSAPPPPETPDGLPPEINDPDPADLTLPVREPSSLPPAHRAH